MEPQTRWPAIVVSSLSVCDKQANFLTDMASVEVVNFRAVVTLYVVLFVGSLYFAYQQKQASKRFNKEHATMSDYALELKGLPTDATDEGYIRSWLQAEFRRVVPSKTKRPPIETDEGLLIPRDPSQVEVQGISICYDYKDRVDEVHKLVHTMNIRLEGEAEAVTKSGNTLADYLGDSSRSSRNGDQDRQTVRDWFEGPDKMKSTGNAFAVLN
jgi:hypothetical protein